MHLGVSVSSSRRQAPVKVSGTITYRDSDWNPTTVAQSEVVLQAPLSVVSSYRTGTTEALSTDDLLRTSRQGVDSTQGSRRVRARLRREEGTSVFDTGHPFRSTQRSITVASPHVTLVSRIAKDRSFYEGQLQTIKPAGWTNSLWPSVGAFVPGPYGPRAVSATDPTNSINNVSTFIGELRQLPNLGSLNAMRLRAQQYRALGADYLNVQFGWAPFVRELAGVIQTALAAKEISDKYLKNSGRNLHRGYRFQEVNKTEIIRSSPAGTLARVFGPGLGGGDGSLNTVTGTASAFLERHTLQRVWFSSAWTYYLSSIDTTEGVNRRAAEQTLKLLDYRITPETLWNLAPWSWLADWVTNVGNNVGNASRFTRDNVVMRYGYLMQETTIHDRIVMSGQSYTSRGPSGLTGLRWLTACEDYLTIDKQRVKASPYGFDRNPDTFSGYQWSILAALGISQDYRKVRSRN